MFSTFESVSAGITFSSTTTFPGCVTAKYGSAVTIIPNVCMSLMAFTCPLPWFSTTSPKFTARPCGDTAHNTYVRYSSPNLVASSKPSNFASISIRLLLLSTFASPEAVCSSSVPWKLSLVDPPARRKFTAFVVRDTLEAVGAADAALCANVGPAATPQIPVTTRQIVAVFTSVSPLRPYAATNLSSQILAQGVPRFLGTLLRPNCVKLRAIPETEVAQP